MSDLKKIIGLSSVLAIGFMLVILSGALYRNWYPLLIVIPFLLAPLPQFLTERYSSSHDFLQEEDRNLLDFGRFVFGATISTGFALPIVFVNVSLTNTPAAIMSCVGGFIIFMVITIYSQAFTIHEEEF
ncbi:vacuolar sorting protein Vps55 [Schizosaccharomyces cryophilus OY26]|uniref:Vacuolar sorting protein Vps55 n=1 Tax=Schizosaccharomyces cryophilus (strain OY26 / ATCC MYA-4695 / CBS 11777 / NBRC 106824 / NRRL Y48691) TaxID=653667 RepID=S9W6L8_SCHCR|nr:vacuolar sorting protein Vps55 [Schizosaccharomyces cryophilus OY26]EPY53485.1 vacuolar sorting protein Vps55 [Schizosaccharomyces cryophilus OY26]